MFKLLKAELTDTLLVVIFAFASKSTSEIAKLLDVVLITILESAEKPIPKLNKDVTEEVAALDFASKSKASTLVLEIELFNVLNAFASKERVPALKVESAENVVILDLASNKRLPATPA